jgi:hypothetical protein
MQTPHLDPASLPNLLFDAVEFGFFTKQATCGPDPVDAFRHALCRNGHSRPSNDTRRVSVSVPVPGSSYVIDAELFVRPHGDEGLVISSGSAIRINPLRMLRHMIGEESAGPIGLDGNDNVVGPTVHRANSLLGVQLGCISRAINALAEAINAALPQTSTDEAEEFWVRSAETCLDLPCSRPAGAVRGLQCSALGGATWTAIDLDRAQVEDVRGSPVMRWWRTEGGPGFKLYVKRGDLVRAEVVLQDRSALRGLIGNPTCSYLDGSMAVCMLLEVGGASHPLLEELVRHFRCTLGEPRTALELGAHLEQLIVLAWGRGAKVGRRPGAASVRGACELLEALLTVGACHAIGLPKTSALRAVLDRLALAGVLVRGGRGASYTVAPEWASAANALGELLLS